MNPSSPLPDDLPLLTDVVARIAPDSLPTLTDIVPATDKTAPFSELEARLRPAIEAMLEQEFERLKPRLADRILETLHQSLPESSHRAEPPA